MTDCQRLSSVSGRFREEGLTQPMRSSRMSGLGATVFAASTLVRLMVPSDSGVASSSKIHCVGGVAALERRLAEGLILACCVVTLCVHTARTGDGAQLG